ncbi:transposase family protein [Streptomyces mirabilis]|uniref:transposase family protein n=1 Tax=Streptomyces mirabilis TaxID=68239 RepID=UPI0036C199F6
MPDPRDPRGVRHALAGVLALAACAVLAGAPSLLAVGELKRSRNGRPPTTPKPCVRGPHQGGRESLRRMWSGPERSCSSVGFGWDAMSPAALSLASVRFGLGCYGSDEGTDRE